jgi:Na+/melibiose symporter-like transporter
MIEPGPATAAPAATAAATTADDRPPLPLSQLVTLSIYWLGILTIMNGLGSLILPARIEDMLGPDLAGIGIAVVNGVAMIAPIIVQPTVGVLSDYTITRWGRRKPYIFIGGLLDIVFLYGIATSDTFLTLVAFYFLIQVSSNFAQGPFQGYVPDLVPARQVGLASGLMGLMLVGGTIVGVLIANVGLQTGSIVAATMALGAVELVAMLIVVTRVREGTSGPKRTMSWGRLALSAWGTDILREKSVIWLLLVRLLFLGATAATSFALFYFDRTHGLTREEASTMVTVGTIIIGLTSLVATIPGARVSDRLGRKPVIYGGMVLLALGLVGLIVAPSPSVAVALFVPAGLGIGTFLSVDWALMSDVIPKHTSARYMGILNAGTALAAPVYQVFGGVAIFLVSQSTGDPSAPGGPIAAMFVALGFVAVSALALSRVDPRRRELLPAPAGAPSPAEIAPA